MNPTPASSSPLRWSHLVLLTLLLLLPASTQAQNATGAVFEAEAFDARNDRGQADWQAVSSMPGMVFSGDGGLQAQPVNAARANAADASSVRYNVTLDEAGSYYFHVRGAGSNDARNSVFIGLNPDGANATLLHLPVGGLDWATSRGGIALSAGNHTLAVFVREAGTVIDRVALTTSATPPPPLDEPGAIDFATWWEGYFGDAPEDPLGDFDNDEIANVVEFELDRDPTTPDDLNDSGFIFPLLDLVYGWQIARPSNYTTGGDGDRSWVAAAFYAGTMWLYRETNNPRYFNDMLAIAEGSNWRLGNRLRHADDHAIGQTYLDLYMLADNPQESWLAPLQSNFQTIIDNPIPFDQRSPRGNGPYDDKDYYSWCDALFMSPPTFAMLAAVTGEQVWRDHLYDEWVYAADTNGGYRNEHRALYNQPDGLYYRDYRYVGDTEPNGEGVYWSRGNGWVIAGICRVLEYLPADSAYRPYFENQLREMAAAALTSQLFTNDIRHGLWTTSILYPARWSEPEVSGSAFIAYALAYGLNHGILDDATYRGAMNFAWRGLVRAVTAGGELRWVQPRGFEPDSNDASNAFNAYEKHYGPGAFLLAGTEVARYYEDLRNIPQAPVLFADVQKLGGGQFSSPWFGEFLAYGGNATGFIESAEHGLGYVLDPSGNATGAFVYGFGFETWLWLDPALYPWIWVVDRGWLWYGGRDEEGNRTFWSADEGAFITLP